MDFDIDLYTARFGSNISGIVFIILAVIAKATESGLFYFLTFAALAVVIFFSWFIRCPACGHRLGRYYGHMEHCPHCGEHL